HQDLHTFPTRRSSDLGGGHYQATSLRKLVNHVRQAGDHLVVANVVVPPVHHRATELHVVSAFYPVECVAVVPIMPVPHAITGVLDRKSTRLNSSHQII